MRSPKKRLKRFVTFLVLTGILEVCVVCVRFTLKNNDLFFIYCKLFVVVVGFFSLFFPHTFFSHLGCFFRVVWKKIPCRGRGKMPPDISAAEKSVCDVIHYVIILFFHLLNFRLSFKKLNAAVLLLFELDLRESRIITTRLT